MNQNKEKENFFDWVVGLFKKEIPEVKAPPTEEELAAEAKWLNIKAKYAIEYLKEQNAWFVKYRHHGGELWYLRRWTEDYTLERARGNAIRIGDPNELDQVIRSHQEWISDGHISISFN